MHGGGFTECIIVLVIIVIVATTHELSDIAFAQINLSGSPDERDLVTFIVETDCVKSPCPPDDTQLSYLALVREDSSGPIILSGTCSIDNILSICHTLIPTGRAVIILHPIIKDDEERIAGVSPSSPQCNTSPCTIHIHFFD